MHISFLRQRVAAAPDIRCGIHKHRNKRRELIWIIKDGTRVDRHFSNTKEGRRLHDIKQRKEDDIRILTLLEKQWFKDYNDTCESVFVPDYGQTPDKIFFDSLGERCNNYRPSEDQKSPPPTYYKGKPFKSKLEADFARLMDDYGIPYKYEPRISTVGRKTRCPDFVLYLPWLDLLILVEIYGACSKKEYLPTVRDRQHEYLSCNWIPGVNMLALYYTDETAYIPEMVIEEIETIEVRRLLFLRDEKSIKIPA